MYLLKIFKSYLIPHKNYILDYINWNKLLANLNLQNDCWFIICPYGIGDTYFICALLKQFLLRHGNTKAVLIVKKSHLDVVELFTEDIYRVITFDKLNLRDINRFSQFKCGYPFIGHPSDFKYDFDRFLGTEGLTLLDLYRIMLQMPIDAPLTQPKLDYASINAAKKKFFELGLPANRTVILAPEANSLSTLPLEFWCHLSEHLKLQGWTVCINICNSSTCIPGTTPINFSLSEAISIAEIAGWVISSRSGLCDLLSSAKCKLSIIYMKQSWYAGTPLTGSSLKRMGLSETVLEYEVSESESIDILISKIISDHSPTSMVKKEIA
jgi:hypothetical protein